MRPAQRQAGALDELQAQCARWETESPSSTAFARLGTSVLEALTTLLADPAVGTVDDKDHPRLLRLLAYALGRADRLRPPSLILHFTQKAAAALVAGLAQDPAVGSRGKCCLLCVHAFAGVCDQVRRADRGSVESALASRLGTCAAALFSVEFLAAGSASSADSQWERLLEFLAESYTGAVAALASEGSEPPPFPALSLGLNPHLFPEVAKLRFVDAVSLSLLIHHLLSLSQLRRYSAAAMRNGNSSLLTRWVELSAEALEGSCSATGASVSREVFERLLWLGLTLRRHRATTDSPAVKRLLSSIAQIGESQHLGAPMMLAGRCLSAGPLPGELAELAAVCPDSPTGLGVCCELVMLTLSTHPLPAVRLLVNCALFVVSGPEDAFCSDTLQLCLLETLGGREAALPLEALESLAGGVASEGFLSRCGKMLPQLLRGLTAHLSRTAVSALTRDPCLPLYRFSKQCGGCRGADALQAIAAAAVLSTARLAANGQHGEAAEAAVAALEVLSSELGAVDAFSVHRLLQTAAASSCRGGGSDTITAPSAASCEWAVVLEFERMKLDNPITATDPAQLSEEAVIPSGGRWRLGSAHFAALVRRLHMRSLSKSEDGGFKRCVSGVRQCLRYVEEMAESLTSDSELLVFCLLRGSVSVVFHVMGSLGLAEEQMKLVEAGFRCLSIIADSRISAELSTLLGELALLLRVMGTYYNVPALYSFEISNCDDYIRQSWLRDCASKVQLLVESARSGEILSIEADFGTICGSREPSRALKAAVCIATSRLSMVLSADHLSAMTWAKQALYHTADAPLCSLYRLEAVLLVAETYAQVGFIEGALSYLGEATSQVRCGPRFLQLTVHAHAKRIWQSMDSPRALVPASKGKLSEESPQDSGMLWCALDVLIDAVERMPANKSDALSFRHFSRLGEERLQFTPVPPHVVPLLSEFRAERDKPINFLEGNVCFAGCKSAGIEDLESAALDLLRRLPGSYCGFELLRNLRRRAAVDLVLAGSSAVDAFILASLSCGTSSECLSSVQRADADVISLIRAGGSGADGFAKLKTFLLGQPDTLTLAVYEKSAKVILLGCYFRGSCVMVGIPCSSEVDALMADWAATMQRNKDLLRATADAENIAQWSNEEKRGWWRDREAVNERISQLLSSLENVIGPWRVLLSGIRPELVPVDSILSSLHVSSEDECKSLFIKNWTGLIQSSAASGCLKQAEASLALRNIFGAASKELDGEECDLMISRLLDLDNHQNRSADAESESGHREVVDEETPEQIAFQLSKLKVVELRSMLKEKSERTMGKKDELVRRLLSVLMREKDNIDPQTLNHSSTTPGSSVTRSSVPILDETFQQFPVESMPSISASNITRLPGLYMFLKLRLQHSDPPPLLSAFINSWYLIDPQNNLPGTQQTVVSSFRQYIECWSWDGFVATAPSEEQFR